MHPDAFHFLQTAPQTLRACQYPSVGMDARDRNTLAATLRGRILALLPAFEDPIDAFLACLPSLDPMLLGACLDMGPFDSHGHDKIVSTFHAFLHNDSLRLNDPGGLCALVQARFEGGHVRKNQKAIAFHCLRAGRADAIRSILDTVEEPDALIASCLAKGEALQNFKACHTMALDALLSHPSATKSPIVVEDIELALHKRNLHVFFLLLLHGCRFHSTLRGTSYGVTAHLDRIRTGHGRMAMIARLRSASHIAQMSTCDLWTLLTDPGHTGGCP